MSDPRRPFDKPALLPGELLALLRKRGLDCGTDDNAALHRLRTIGFYRLSAYMLPFQLGDGSGDHHRFVSGVTFDRVAEIYDFDARLRELTFSAISDVEVAIKAALTDTLGPIGGPHWFLAPTFFKDAADHRKVLASLLDEAGPAKAVLTVSLGHYFDKYTGPLLPPSWMLMEALQFGALSKMYEKLALGYRKKVAEVFGLDDSILCSWIEAICYTRNLCAHHQRLWNRTFTKTPKVAKDFKDDLNPNSTYYASAVTVRLLGRCGLRPDFLPTALADLFSRFPQIEPRKLGFPENWSTRRIWTSVGGSEQAA